jgi:hypothetical protein
MSTLQLVAKVIGYLAGIGGAIAGVIKFGFWIRDQIHKRRQTAAQGYAIPPRTLTVTLQQQREYWWHMGGIREDPAMQIVGEFLVTNIYSKPVRVVQIELRYGPFGSRGLIGDVSISRSLSSQYYDAFTIPPNDTRQASFHMWLVPPVAKAKQPFVPHSMRMTDHFGNKHRIKGVRFEYR